MGIYHINKGFSYHKLHKYDDALIMYDREI